MSKDPDPDFLNREFAESHGHRPYEEQQKPTSHDVVKPSQIRKLNREVVAINKQIQSIHKKLGGKEGHTITSLSLENHSLRQEVDRLRQWVHKLEEDLNKCSYAYEEQVLTIEQYKNEFNHLKAEIARLNKALDMDSSVKEIMRLRKEIDKMKIERELNDRLAASRAGQEVKKKSGKNNQECHKISLKF
tara:strand:- start:177 stop:743 length:567 start_codon:yes stop_codon:yes gene_type:complete